MPEHYFPFFHTSLLMMDHNFLIFGETSGHSINLASLKSFLERWAKCKGAFSCRLFSLKLLSYDL